MNLLVGIAIFVGIAGIVVPILPGAILSLAAILVWAIVEHSATGWVVFAIAAVAATTVGGGVAFAATARPRRQVVHTPVLR